MSRSRPLLAILLAVTWCSAAWHVDLEAVGMLFEHEHHSHSDDHAEHAPVAPHDDHEQVFARDVAKDHIRVGAGAGLWFVLLAVATWRTAAWRPRHSECRSAPDPNETDPPLAHVWHFVQRCAPESAAPPALV
jgi:hypothetical protein